MEKPAAQDCGMLDPGDQAASPPLRDEEICGGQAGTMESSPGYVCICVHQCWMCNPYVRILENILELLY